MAGFYPIACVWLRPIFFSDKPNARIKENQAMPETGEKRRGKLSETIKIPILSIEKKTIPVIYSWCNRITSLMKWEVECGKRIAPTHGICQRCLETAAHGYFPGKQGKI